MGPAPDYPDSRPDHRIPSPRPVVLEPETECGSLWWAATDEPKGGSYEVTISHLGGWRTRGRLSLERKGKQVCREKQGKETRDSGDFPFPFRRPAGSILPCGFLRLILACLGFHSLPPKRIPSNCGQSAVGNPISLGSRCTGLSEECLSVRRPHK